MHVHIDYWAVLLAGVSSMIIGTIYYSDLVLGKQWKELSQVDLKRFSKSMPRTMPFIFIGALVTAYIVAYFAYLFQYFFQASWFSAGLETSLLLWFGVSATSLYIASSLDQRPPKLTVIAVGNRLISILAMGMIIGWLHP